MNSLQEICGSFISKHPECIYSYKKNIPPVCLQDVSIRLPLKQVIELINYFGEYAWCLNIDMSGNKNVSNKNLIMLGNIHTLNLERCENITDVSALGNVHILNLSRCYNITDVSALGNVHTLDLSCLYVII